MLTICPKLLHILLAVLLCLAGNAARANSPLNWTTDLQRAKYEAKVNRTPYLLYFYNMEARPAREMAVKTLQHTKVTELIKPYVRVTVNQSKNPDLAKAMMIIKVPTVIFFDPDGRELDRAVGFKTPEEFEQYMARLNKGYADSLQGKEQIAPFAGSAIDITTPSREKYAFRMTHKAPDAQSVHLVGDFNDWRTDAHPLTRQPNGDWMLDIYLREGVYEYLYLVNGSEYVPDANNIFEKRNPYDGVNNVILAGTPHISPLIQGNTVTFLIYRPEAQKIELAGNFTNWTPTLMFRKQDDPGMWGIQFTFPAGRYTYKFLIDGEWTNDPENYLLDHSDPGAKNSVFVISAQKGG